MIEGGVTRMNIIIPILWFVGYIITHVAIGIITKNQEKSLADDPENEKKVNTVKQWKLVFKWYPFAYLWLILIAFLGQ